MNVAEKQKTTNELAGRLAEAQAKTDASDFSGALGLIREIKTTERKNIYVLAFEKQVEQLAELSNAHILTDEQRTDILESIPGIIERALDESASPGKKNGSEPRAAVFSRDEGEKHAALEWLKDSYFQHAHDHVKKGEYQHALSEIRRVYIIEPSNSTAQNLERQIEQLAKLSRGDVTGKTVPSPKTVPLPPRISGSDERTIEQHSDETIKATAGTEMKEPDAEIVHVEAVIDKLNVGDAEDLEPHLVMAEEWSSPQEHPLEEPDKSSKEAPRKGRTFLLVFVLLAIAALGAVLFLYWVQQRTLKKTQLGLSSTLSTQQGEGIIGAPAEAAEQNFVVSSQGGDSQESPKIAEAETPTEKNPPTEETPAKKNTSAQKTRAQKSSKPEKPPQKAKEVVADADQVVPPTKKDEAADRSAGPSTPGTLQPAGTGDETAAPAPFVPVEKPPQIVKLERPAFSELRFDPGSEGKITIQVQINTQGKPIQTKILKTSNPILNAPVIEAVMNSQYLPAQMASGPVTAWLTIPFRFQFAQ